MSVATRAMTPISLPEVLAAAELTTRVDRKYVVDRGTWDWLAQRLAGTHRVLDIDGLRSFQYESVYFDTPALQSFYAAAHRRRRRFKVRIRTYLESGECMLEVKHRGGRGETVKTRYVHPLDARTSLTREAVDRIADLLDEPAVATQLTAVLVSRYSRTTLVDTAAGVRVTCDADLGVAVPGRAPLLLSDRVVVETKGGTAPTAADRLLWSAGIRPVRLSKYGTGLAALRSELPSNVWHRTIRRELGWRAPSALAGPGLPRA